jgi:hypothetical protein
VWKLYYLIKSNKISLVIIFIDYLSLVSISKKSSIILIVSTKKLNLRLVYIGEYLSRFPLNIRYKLGKVNFILDILSYLKIIDNGDRKVKLDSNNKGELNILYIFNIAKDKALSDKLYMDFNKGLVYIVILIEIILDFK